MAKGYNIGGRNYTFDEFLRALDMLDARKNQYGYTVTNPLEMAAMEENLGGQPFSFDPRSGQFVRNPSTTQEQCSMIGDVYGGVGGTGGLGGYSTETGQPQSMMWLKGPGGNVPTPTSSSEVQRFLGLPPETQKLIANMTPEEYGRLKLMGGGIPGVRDEETGLTPPGATGEEGPALGQTVGEWLKEQRGKQRTRHKPAEISPERKAQLSLSGLSGLESILRAMAGRGVTPLEAVNSLGAKGLLEEGTTPFTWMYGNTPGTPWRNIVPPTQPVKPTAVNPYDPAYAQYQAALKAYNTALTGWNAWNAAPTGYSAAGGGYWLNQAQSQYSDLLKERANQIASERLIPFERAKKLAEKQMRAPTSGAFATGAMSSTWK